MRVLALPKLLPLLALVTFAAGCPHRQAAQAPAQDWYLKNNLFAAFSPGARDLSMVNAYLLELACYAGDQGTFDLYKVLETWGFDEHEAFRQGTGSIYGFVASNDQLTVVTFG